MLLIKLFKEKKINTKSCFFGAEEHLCSTNLELCEM